MGVLHLWSETHCSGFVVACWCCCSGSLGMSVQVTMTAVIKDSDQRRRAAKAGSPARSPARDDRRRRAGGSSPSSPSDRRRRGSGRALLASRQKNTLRLTNREAFIDSIAAFRRAYEPQPRPFDDADECAPALLRFAFSIWRISDMLLFSRRNTS